MTTVSKVTPQSAPRDAEGLMKLGIFQLRLLIEGMGALSTEQEKMAFAKMQTPEKVQLAQQLLANWDKQNGANGTNGVAAPAMPAPMMMPPQGMPVVQVDPASVAAAAQAAMPAPPPAKRAPVTSDTRAAAAPDLGVDIVNLLNRLSAQQDEMNSTLAAGIKELTGSVNEVAKANHTHAENYKAVYGALQNMNGAISLVALQSKLAMALVLPLAEQVLGASREDILRMTLGDIDSIQAFIQQATTPGKG
jgi:hypothetical protein